jgi:hypothetical protein
MAGAGIGNPAGAIIIADFGNPKIFSARAKEVISGGVFAFASGVSSNVVSSGLNSFVNSDVVVAKDASGLQFNGIVMQDTSSGGACPVATEGVFIVLANGTVTAGNKVVCDGKNAVANIGGSPSVINQVGHDIGRAWTSATSGNYCVVQFKN